MNRMRFPCDMCDKSFVNIASHKRKVHDVFTFLYEPDIFTMYKNDEVFERYAWIGSGTDDKHTYIIYESILTGNRQTFLFQYEDPECTFEVFTNSHSVVIKRRPMVKHTTLPIDTDTD